MVHSIVFVCGWVDNVAAAAFEPRVCSKVDFKSGIVALVPCVEDNFVPGVFNARDGGDVDEVEFCAADILQLEYNVLTPIGVGDVVVARLGDTLVFRYAVVVDLHPSSAVVDVEFQDLGCDCSEWASVCRAFVVVVCARDAAGFLADVERGGDLCLELDADRAQSEHFFEVKFVTGISRQMSSREIEFVVVTPHDTHGFDVHFQCHNEVFSNLLRAKEYFALDAVADFYEAAVGTRKRNSRLLHELHMLGATLFCVARFKKQNDLNNVDVEPAWFVAVRDRDVVRRECLLRSILNAVNAERRKKALFAVARSVTRFAGAARRTTDESELLARLLVTLQAGIDAPSVCLREGWSWSTMSSWLELVYGVQWSLRLDLLGLREELIDMYVNSLIEPVKQPVRARPSDEWMRYVEMYFSSFGDTVTDLSRRTETQKVTNPNATWRGAAAFVEEQLLIETGDRTHVNHVTLYRRSLASRVGTLEAKRRRHVVLMIRPALSARGDVGDKEDSHYANAQTRIVRERVGNQLPRDNAAVRTERGAVFSRDCKAKIDLRNEPVAKPQPEWHVVTFGDDGKRLSAYPVLPSISAEQNKSDTVVSHIFLRLDEGVANANMGTPRGVLSHGRTPRSAPLHAAEVLLLAETFPALLLDPSGKIFEQLVIISDRGPHENMTHQSVLICHRYLAHLFELKKLTLSAYSVSSHNPVERVHACTNKSLGSTPIGVAATRDDDVRAVAKRLAPAKFNRQFIKNVLLLDGVAEELVPIELVAFCRGNMSNSSAPEKEAARKLLPIAVPVLPRVAALRRRLGLSTGEAITFAQLLALSSKQSPSVFSCEHMLVMTAFGEARNVVTVPIPATAVIDCAKLVRSGVQSYLSYAELSALTSDVQVECEDGQVVSIGVARTTPDLFLPSAILNAYFKRTAEAELYSLSSIARLSRFTLLDATRVREELEHRVKVRNARREGAKKAAATRKRKMADRSIEDE
jgi:hypothetical protein